MSNETPPFAWCREHTDDRPEINPPARFSVLDGRAWTRQAVERKIRPVEIAYFDPLGRAWGRMKTCLFAPFDGRKWLVLGFTAWLAGMFENGNGTTGLDVPTDKESWSEWGGGAADQLAAIGMGIVAVMAVLAAVVLFLALLWLSSRFELIFLDNVVRNEGAVRAPWKRWAARGNSLFVWRLFFSLVVLIVAGGVVLTGAVLTGVTAGVGLGELSWVTVVVFVAGLVGFVLLPAAYVNLFLGSFVVPIMFRFDVSASEAWRRFLPMLRDHLFHFLVYGIFYLVLNLMAVSFLVLVGLFTCCVGFLLIALPYVGTVFTLPIWVTLRAFSVEFLAQFDPQLALLGPAPVVPIPPPPQQAA
ncbi:MAG: DUF7544 domain-containing protein [bacterium]